MALGNFCKRPMGYWRHGQWGKCDNCDRRGFKWYPKCKENHNPVWYSPWCETKCPDGWQKRGPTCQKPSQWRGTGHGQYCGPTQKQFGPWCWNKCKDGHSNVGPLCLADCPKDRHVCAGALCLSPKEKCTVLIFKEGMQMVQAIKNFATENPIGGVINIAKFVKGLIYPICP